MNYRGSKLMKEINDMLLKAKLDENSARYWAKEEGKEEPKTQEKIRIVEKMLEKGFDIKLISQITGLDIEKIKSFKKKYKKV